MPFIWSIPSKTEVTSIPFTVATAIWNSGYASPNYDFYTESTPPTWTGLGYGNPNFLTGLQQVFSPNPNTIGRTYVQFTVPSGTAKQWFVYFYGYSSPGTGSWANGASFGLPALPNQSLNISLNLGTIAAISALTPTSAKFFYINAMTFKATIDPTIINTDLVPPYNMDGGLCQYSLGTLAAGTYVLGLNILGDGTFPTTVRNNNTCKYSTVSGNNPANNQSLWIQSA